MHIPLPRPRGDPCQPPGLCSIVADAVPLQVDVRQGLVDLQRFGEGLWPKGWQAGRLTMRSSRTFVTLLKLLWHGGCQHETQGSLKGQRILKEGKAKQSLTSAAKEPENGKKTIQGPAKTRSSLVPSHFHLSSRCIPLEGFLESSTGPTPAQHLLCLPSLNHHPYPSTCAQRPPLPSPRPLLLPCR